jgi:hypothetical protein
MSAGRRRTEPCFGPQQEAALGVDDELVLVGAVVQGVQIEITSGKRTAQQQVSRARPDCDRAQQFEVEQVGYRCRPDQNFAWPLPWPMSCRPSLVLAAREGDQLHQVPPRNQAVTISVPTANSDIRRSGDSHHNLHDCSPCSGSGSAKTFTALSTSAPGGVAAMKASLSRGDGGGHSRPITCKVRQPGSGLRRRARTSATPVSARPQLAAAWQLFHPTPAVLTVAARSAPKSTAAESRLLIGFGTSGGAHRLQPQYRGRPQPGRSVAEPFGRVPQGACCHQHRKWSVLLGTRRAWRSLSGWRNAKRPIAHSWTSRSKWRPTLSCFISQPPTQRRSWTHPRARKNQLCVGTEPEIFLEKPCITGLRSPSPRC